ncbi:MAG: GIY-YIG nuclease family protein [Gammaproteobacteria bacterium]|nr:GIY-YIG nuclease family protein [Gammaproteobacteria bacterium]MDH5651733.1 GIY-YIG nuclease family protein [Gammaproteobacteria bacterium]
MTAHSLSALAGLHLRSRPGTYLLLFENRRKQTVTIGRLGEHCLPVGFYCYIGSAFGPGGVRARVRHHLNMATKPHWHLDYVRPRLAFREVWCQYDVRDEHNWALQTAANMTIPIPGFGAADCACNSHFFYLSGKPDVAQFQTTWRDAICTKQQQISFCTIEQACG